MARAGRFESRYDLVLLVGCAFLGFFVRALPAHLSDPIASTIRRTVLAPLVSLQRGAELTRGALDTYETRTISLDSLALQAMEARALADENATLRAMLTLGARLRWGFVPADALSGSSSAEEFTLLLTAGENAGVRVKSAVIAPEGLVGMVQRVDPTMSIAIIWPHPDFRVSAMDVDGNAFGIVQAHLGREPERYLLEMRGVAYRSELTPGTEIVSSGLGGVYPKGILIGTVLREIETPEGWTRTYLLLPAVRPQDLRSVMILDPQRAAEGVQQVWARPASRDSVVRGIVNASDSIARLAARAEARRQQLVEDSIANEAAARQATDAPATPDAGQGAAARVPGQAAPRTPQPSTPPAAQPATGQRPPAQRTADTSSRARDTSTPRDTAAGRAAAPNRDTVTRPAPAPAGQTRPAIDTSTPPDSARLPDTTGRPAPPLPDTTRRVPPDTTRRVPPPPVTVPPPAEGVAGAPA